MVRVRFAPSPTGYFHIGSARSVLFNWLFARQNQGKFVLRIEDTDTERSKPEYEKNIHDAIKWLGLDVDEGVEVGGPYAPYRQSERLDLYEKYLRQLLDEDKAYYCFCSKEQLDLDRQAMLSQGMAPKYTGRCRHIPKDEAEKKVVNGEAAVIRFKVPETEIEFHDLIRDKVKFNAGLMGDIVIAKNIRSPLYNFSAAIDDNLMGITHVIRGEEHLSNTPKQILIQRALGFNEPKYAHLPLILTSDRRKMSKRYLESSLDDYINDGYLPEAIINFLAFLGWHPKDDKEILSLDELVKEFDLKRVQKAGAVFNIEKLEWFNAQYLKKISAENLAEKIKPFVPESWATGDNKEIFIKAIEAERDRMKKLTDFKDLADFFFEIGDYDVKLLAWPRTAEIDKQKTLANLKVLSEEINKIFKADFNKENLEKIITPLTSVWGRGELLWPLRAALSGKEASAGPYEIIGVLGKEETLRRLEIAIKKLNY